MSDDITRIDALIAEAEGWQSGATSETNRAAWEWQRKGVVAQLEVARQIAQLVQLLAVTRLIPVEPKNGTDVHTPTEG